MKIKHSPIRSKDLTVEEITAADEMRRMLVSQINPARLKQVLADAERQKQELARQRAERRKAWREQKSRWSKD